MTSNSDQTRREIQVTDRKVPVESDSEWCGGGANVLALTSVINEVDFCRLLIGLHPRTKAPLVGPTEISADALANLHQTRASNKE